MNKKDTSNMMKIMGATRLLSGSNYGRYENEQLFSQKNDEKSRREGS